jgi:hypothetical protein
MTFVRTGWSIGTLSTPNCVIISLCLFLTLFFNNCFQFKRCDSHRFFGHRFFQSSLIICINIGPQCFLQRECFGWVVQKKVSSPDLFTLFSCLMCVPVGPDLSQLDQQHVHGTSMVSRAKCNVEVCSFEVICGLSDDHLCFLPSLAARWFEVEVTPEGSQAVSNSFVVRYRSWGWGHSLICRCACVSGSFICSLGDTFIWEHL